MPLLKKGRTPCRGTGQPQQQHPKPKPKLKPPNQKNTGECSKAEVERAATTRRADLAERRLSSLEGESHAATARAASLETREREARQKARSAAAELIKVYLYLFTTLSWLESAHERGPRAPESSMFWIGHIFIRVLLVPLGCDIYAPKPF